MIALIAIVALLLLAVLASGKGKVDEAVRDAQAQYPDREPVQVNGWLSSLALLLLALLVVVVFVGMAGGALPK